MSSVSNIETFIDIWETTEYPLHPEDAKQNVWPTPVFTHARNTIDGISRVSKRVLDFPI